MNNFYLNYVMNILKLKNCYQVHVYFVGKKYSFEQITNIRKNLPLLKKKCELFSYARQIYQLFIIQKIIKFILYNQNLV